MDERLHPEIHETEHITPLDLKNGDRCPVCVTGVMDYNGLLELACPVCGYHLGGCFT